MRLVFQVTGGILVAAVVLAFIAVLGTVKTPPSAGAFPTPTAMPNATVTDRDIAALASDCGIDPTEVRREIDRFYQYAPLPSGGIGVGEQHVLDGLMPMVNGPRPGSACETLSLGNLASFTP